MQLIYRSTDFVILIHTLMRFGAFLEIHKVCRRVAKDHDHNCYYKSKASGVN